tara:strand:+ start:865 stop:1986 length:1122 start_codon:yes stop_codon:yes gene_type:complete
MEKSFFSEYYNWWKNIDKIIFLLIISLFLLGLFFSLVSTSIIASDKMNTNSYYFFLKHFIFVLLGLFLIIISSIIDKERIINFSLVLFVITFISLLLVPLIGVEVKGSKRWLDIGFLPRFQPIELLKPFVIVFLGVLLNSNYINNKYFRYLFSFILILPIIILLALQPDIGQTILIVLVWISLIFISGISLLILFSSFAVFGSIISYMIFSLPKFYYIKSRILSFLNPSSGNNYQSERASEAIINGGLFGKGIGEGTLNSKIPEAHTDYIISVISEEFGIAVVILIMITFLFLAYQVIKKIDEEEDLKIKLILLGCITLILLQTFIHIGVNIRILPTTGMTLPFLSYGGSSIISTAIISGIILNFTKRKINYK